MEGLLAHEDCKEKAEGQRAWVCLSGLDSTDLTFGKSNLPELVLRQVSPKSPYANRSHLPPPLPRPCCLCCSEILL